MIALITPTGGRPTQVRLLSKWMQAQTYKGNVLWIIVDDCDPTTVIDNMPTSFPMNWKIINVFPRPVWNGTNTQGRNLQAAINELKNWEVKRVFIIEDDDYYSPEYLRIMNGYLDGFKIVGEASSLYYDVTNRTFKDCHNHRHASLFQTAFDISMLPEFEKALTGTYFDINFWQTETEKKIVQSRLSIGIKGLPGRNGIGIGHRKRMLGKDPQAKFLKDTIGIDANEYLKFYE